MTWEKLQHEDIADGDPGDFTRVNRIAQNTESAHSTHTREHTKDGAHNSPTLPRGWCYVTVSNGVPTLVARTGIVKTPTWDKVWQEDNSGGPSFVDITTDTNDAGANDAQPFPAGAGVNDSIYFGSTLGIFDVVRVNTGTAGVGTYTVTWEYYNGSWTGLSGVTDGTTSFKTTGIKDVTYTVPTDSVAVSINGTTAHYIRAKRDGGTVTTDPLITQAWSGPADNGTGQVGIRLTEDASSTSYIHAEATSAGPEAASCTAKQLTTATIDIYRWVGGSANDGAFYAEFYVTP